MGMGVKIKIKTPLCKGFVDTSSGARFEYEPDGEHAKVKINNTGTGFFGADSAREAAEFFNNLAAVLENQEK